MFEKQKQNLKTKQKKAQKVLAEACHFCPAWPIQPLNGQIIGYKTHAFLAMAFFVQ